MALAEDKKAASDGRGCRPVTQSPLACRRRGQRVGTTAGTAKGSVSPTSSRRSRRIALRNVLAHSPELNIHDAARLVIDFRDVPLELMPPPSSRATKSA